MSANLDAGEPLGSEGELLPGAAYGTFLVAGVEFGVEVAQIREVVNLPDGLDFLSGSPPAVRGVFPLRGDVIPVLDLTVALGLEAEPQIAVTHIAVVESDGVVFGLVIDRSGSVVQAAGEPMRLIECSTEDYGGLLEAMILVERDERLIQVLSMEGLRVASQVPSLCRVEESEQQNLDLRTYSKAIIVRVAEIELGFPIMDVLEIQAGLRLDRGPDFFPHCRGQINLRGWIYPVLDLRLALGEKRPRPVERLLLVERHGASVALVVDAFVETREYPDDEELPIPRILVSGVSRICQSAISRGSDQAVPLVDMDQLLAEFEVRNFNKLINGQERNVVETEEIHDEEVSFFSFRIGDSPFCLPMDDVLEVQGVDESMVSNGDPGAAVQGLLNLRGTMVPLIDACARFGWSRPPEATYPSALVIGRPGATFGLLTDEIVDIIRVPASKVHDCGDILTNAPNLKRFKSFVKTTILIEDYEGPSGSMILLDTEALLRDPTEAPVTGRQT